VKKILLPLIILILAFTPVCVFADPSEYMISSYDVDVTVNEDNTFDIVETITADFAVPKHGIFRTIPLKNDITRLDGTKSTNRAVVSNIRVNEQYTVSNDSGNKVIKIGDPDITLTGSKTYTIRYTYDIGRDTGENYDELYLNLIGNSWDTIISGLTFTITMPNDNWQRENLGFSAGAFGSTANDNIEYEINGNVITGSYREMLWPNEGLTVRLELPEGYFTVAEISASPFIILIFIIPVIFAAASFVLWRKYGKDDEVIETVEFYPPKGRNSAEVGFLYKGLADNKDVTSLLIYLANKGYIRIEECENKKDFKIIKVKDYDGYNKNEELFLNGLFKKKASASVSQVANIFKGQSVSYDYSGDGITEVTKDDLYDSFYVTLNRIKTNINRKENKNEIYETTTLSKSISVLLMVIITFALITFPPLLAFSDSKIAITAFLLTPIGLYVMFTCLFGSATNTIYMNGKAVETRIPMIIFGLGFGLFLGGGPFVFLVLPALVINLIYLYAYIIGVICAFVMFACLNNMSKRTPYGNEMLGKIRGFKNFLEMAEKDKLEELVHSDPVYFYNILPYTYVLGVSDKWISKFAVISLQAPDWYSGYSAFSAAHFGVFMTSTMASAQLAMSSSPSSSSDSGFSGGGFSGGGSGGGGGGSW